ncbi:MAG TPA: hypothetical protein DEH78_01365 [Solibacterales bacterium]|nr:hypothetical protein [Bryobacterales bacterium]
MKRLVLVLLPFALCAQAGKTAAKPAAPATKAAKPGKAITVPQGATLVETGLWKHTGKDGLTWFYRQSPFGVIKVAEKDMQFKPDPGVTSAAATILAVEEGDTVRFEKPSPFGLVRWTKKKTELNDVELAAWKRTQDAAAKTGQEN